MADFKNMNDGVQYNFNPATLIDEVSSDEIYIGNSSGGKDGNASNWLIKKIWKDGTIWNIGFPNGDQSFKFIWNDRASYTYL